MELRGKMRGRIWKSLVKILVDFNYRGDIFWSIKIEGFGIIWGFLLNLKGLCFRNENYILGLEVVC